MSVELVILGFLREREYHGYELKKDIQRRMGPWADVKFGSIYHALKKLVQRGAVEKVGAERRGTRPDRIIYRITERGEEEFLSLLKKLLNGFQRIYPEFCIGFYYAGNLPREEVAEILTQRQAQYEELVETFKQVKELPAHQKIPRVSEVIIDHAILHMAAEVEWLKMARRRLGEEDLYRSPEERGT